MIKEILVLTFAIELMTILGRLFFGSVKSFYKKTKLKLRIHHGYVGLLLLIIGFFISHDWTKIIGASLLLSDAIHHFIILPLWVGRTEFP